LVVSTNSIMDTIIQPVARPSKRGSYRRHTDEFKRAVVAQSLQENASVSRIARQHNVNANQVFAWRKLFGEQPQESGSMVCALLPVTVAPPDMAQRVAEQLPASVGVIDLTVGKARLRLEGAVDAATLALVLQRLLP